MTKRLITLAILLSSFVCLPLLQASSLDFEVTTITKDLDLDVPSINFNVAVKNSSGTPIGIGKISGGCDGCLTATTKDGKKNIAPGATTTLSVLFTAGNHHGKVVKGLSIWSSNNKSGKPDATLICTFNIPVAFTIPTHRLTWGKDQQNLEKTIIIKSTTKQPFPNMSVTIKSDNIAHNITFDETTGAYTLKLKLKTWRPSSIQSLSILTGYKSNRNKRISIFCVCR